MNYNRYISQLVKSLKTHFYITHNITFTYLFLIADAEVQSFPLPIGTYTFLYTG